MFDRYGLACMRKIILALIGLLFSGFVAGEDHVGLEIKKLSLGWGGEGLYVWVKDSYLGELECGQSTVYKFNAVSPLFSENYTMLLSAFYAGAKVNIFVSECLGDKYQALATAVSK